MILSNKIGPALIEALGLPKQTIAFTLRARAGHFVSVECEYAPESDRFVTELANYRVVRIDTPSTSVPHQAEVMGYDAWLSERTARAHAAFMERTSKHLACDWATEEIARYFGAPLTP